MLGKANSLEEAGISVENLPFLAKSIDIVDDSFTITGDHVAHTEISHQANTLGKVLTLSLSLSLLERDRDKVLVGLDLDVLLPPK
jgi:hypothetical protein